MDDLCGKQTLDMVHMDRRLADNSKMNQAVGCPDGINIIRTVTFFSEEKVVFNLEITLKESKTHT